jgi:hypothetical protein
MYLNHPEAGDSRLIRNFCIKPPSNRLSKHVTLPSGTLAVFIYQIHVFMAIYSITLMVRGSVEEDTGDVS